MSRGSYQRRVYITVLQHNDDYTWHDKSMYEYTGACPGYWMRKMIREKATSHMHTKKNQSSSNFTRRKHVLYDEVQKDYGEEAVAAAEQELEAPFDFSKVKEKYQVRLTFVKGTQPFK